MQQIMQLKSKAHGCQEQMSLSDRSGLICEIAWQKAIYDAWNITHAHYLGSL